jgi:hypothetical protein
MKPDTYVCPGCDKEVAVGSRACPHCHPPRKKRKPAKTAAKPSWHQESTAEGLDLPLTDEDFDYDDFVAREFGGKPHQRIGIQWYWWATALVLLVLIILAIASLGDW